MTPLYFSTLSYANHAHRGSYLSQFLQDFVKTCSSSEDAGIARLKRNVFLSVLEDNPLSLIKLFKLIKFISYPSSIYTSFTFLKKREY